MAEVGGGECKGAACAEDAHGWPEGAPQANQGVRMSQNSEEESSLSRLVKHFQAVLSLRSHGGGHHRRDSHFREKDLRFRWASRGLGRKGPRSWV